MSLRRCVFICYQPTNENQSYNERHRSHKYVTICLCVMVAASICFVGLEWALQTTDVDD